MKDRTTHIESDLSRLGLLRTAENDRVAQLLGVARSLELALSEEVEGAQVSLDRLQTLVKGLAKVARDQEKYAAVLKHCEQCVNEDKEVVEQALSDLEVRIAPRKEVLRRQCKST